MTKGREATPMTCKPSLTQVVTTSRRFYLERSRDPSGVSGIGKVADGCEFPSGKIAIAWRGSWPSVAVYDSMKHVLAVHGHGGDTQVVWLDEWPSPEPFDPLLGEGDDYR